LTIADFILAIRVRASAVVVPLPITAMGALLGATRHELLVNVLFTVLVVLLGLLLRGRVLGGMLLSCLLGLGGLLLHGFFSLLIV